MGNSSCDGSLLVHKVDCSTLELPCNQQENISWNSPTGPIPRLKTHAQLGHDPTNSGSPLFRPVPYKLTFVYSSGNLFRLRFQC